MTTSHFESEPLGQGAEGKEFEIALEWKEMLEQAMSGMDTSEFPPEAADAMEGIMDSAMDAMIAATGVTKIEDGVATIEYEMDMDMNIDDLMDMIMGAMPPASDQMPPTNAMLEMSMNMTGTGTYDIELGQYLHGDGRRVRDRVLGDADLGGATGVRHHVRRAHHRSTISAETQPRGWQ